ncbi:alpha,alpha-trehalase TreF [Spirosoma agri]|uniref:alpha,alpha-trehalase TreF n=1 Tax=Spirosoma agri TaxID=1987381 RepID=UPI001FE49C76|nr:alpha,alpha-trehalase TreF [Spirosoma agri]
MTTQPQLLSPDELYGDFFRDVQLSSVFTDSKTFVDCIPKMPPDTLIVLYNSEKTKPDFDLETFVRSNFVVPEKAGSHYVSDRSISTAEHINRLWDHLTRPADMPIEGGSRVALPHPYVVPGGRFREIFYWDSYFTMLGLRDCGHMDLIHGMLDNFAYLIDTFGFIPNGNRTYFLSRSQPPYFALMVKLLAELEDNDSLVKYEPQLRREYDFWMSGRSHLTTGLSTEKRVVRIGDKTYLNRYWDDTPTPRPESYREEIKLAEKAEKRGTAPETLYNHVRAACESGWDFSSRWLADTTSMATIHAADIVPVDLNCLLYFLETMLRDANLRDGGWKTAYGDLDPLVVARQQAIQQTFWNEETGFFHDYDAIAEKQTDALTLAGAFPLFFKLATAQQARRIHDRLKADFLQPGGWVTSLHNTGQQWDWPNGWAPLQWIIYRGLLNYGYVETAHEGRNRWLALNDKVFKATGKMMEKYNVVDDTLTTGGGEYPNQDGFGWTNGVYIRLLKEVGKR